MKASYDFLTRGYVANLHRRRKDELLVLAEKSSLSAVRQEIEDEAEWNGTQAQKLDDCEDAMENRTKPITPTPDRDLHYMDAPNVTNGGDA